MRRLIHALLIAFLSATGLPVYASDIRQASMPEMRCTHSLTGQIAKGDAEALQAALDRWDGGDGGDYIPFRLCLDSLGGSLLEALKIADLGWDFGTAVGPGASCLSACGVIFMAGQRSLEGGIGQVPDRFLHAAGTLGFHAPSLIVTEGQYNQVAVQKAYRVAVQGIAMLTERAGALQMSLANLSQMLATPPEEFYRISTISRAVNWGVTVVGVVAPKNFTELHMANACMAVTPSSLFDGNARAEVRSNGNVVDGTASFGEFDVDTFVQCDISFRRGHDRFDLVDYDHAGGGIPLVPAMFYPSDTPLALLASAPETVALAPAPRVNRTAADCQLFSGGSLTDSEPCVLTEVASITAKARNHLAATYQWPSGAKTVLETLSGDAASDSGEPCCSRSYLLNGETANHLYDFAPYQGYGSCYGSSATGKVFCSRIRY